MKQIKITCPEGYEIDKVEVIDGAAVVTYKEEHKMMLTLKDIVNTI